MCYFGVFGSEVAWHRVVPLFWEGFFLSRQLIIRRSAGSHITSGPIRARKTLILGLAVVQSHSHSNAYSLRLESAQASFPANISSPDGAGKSKGNSCANGIHSCCDDLVNGVDEADGKITVPLDGQGN